MTSKKIQFESQSISKLKTTYPELYEQVMSSPLKSHTNYFMFEAYVSEFWKGVSRHPMVDESFLLQFAGKVPIDWDHVRKNKNLSASFQKLYYNELMGIDEEVVELKQERDDSSIVTDEDISINGTKSRLNLIDRIKDNGEEASTKSDNPDGEAKTPAYTAVQPQSSSDEIGWDEMKEDIDLPSGIVLDDKKEQKLTKEVIDIMFNESILTLDESTKKFVRKALHRKDPELHKVLLEYPLFSKVLTGWVPVNPDDIRENDYVNKINYPMTLLAVLLNRNLPTSDLVDIIKHTKLEDKNFQVIEFKSIKIFKELFTAMHPRKQIAVYKSFGGFTGSIDKLCEIYSLVKEDLFLTPSINTLQLLYLEIIKTNRIINFQDYSIDMSNRFVFLKKFMEVSYKGYVVKMPLKAKTLCLTGDEVGLELSEHCSHIRNGEYFIFNFYKGEKLQYIARFNRKLGVEEVLYSIDGNITPSGAAYHTTKSLIWEINKDEKINGKVK